MLKIDLMLLCRTDSRIVILRCCLPCVYMSLCMLMQYVLLVLFSLAHFSMSACVKCYTFSLILPSPLLSEWRRYFVARRPSRCMSVHVCVRWATFITYRLYAALVSAAKSSLCAELSGSHLWFIRLLAKSDIQGRLSLSTIGDKCAKDNFGGILLKV